MEDEWEEEEQLVVVELSGIINNDFLSKCRTTCKILDIDSERPMMQVGQYVFAGEYEDALGTCVLFEEAAPRKGQAHSGPGLKYMCHTVKKLTMQRIFLTEKMEDETSAAGGYDDKQDTSCMSNESETDKTHGMVEEILNTDLEDSTVD
ncbi:PREDICTED: general transcription factor 3C polypeptide 6 isoform X1 [Poecilia mexicana]|uniref:General transcription factor IIIC subunit 6 n=2 Tax=Poecilia TaxID=8080 RepID=A0A087YL34_POEFO|nr:PREDICTED: general transcription factor 3C polypeptide 6 isoform X1 [Poecilia formosa]XP_014854263.1 PREDICTED: general transcription factor 3C polypeptide 6 isoform X1 [Poecilia mexicana]